MRHGLVLATTLVLVAVGASLGVAACGSSTSRDQFDQPAAGDGGFEGQAPLVPNVKPCVGLECKRVKCDTPDTTTTLTGKVYDPAGANPLYNVMVYIPGGPNGDAPLEPFPDGVQCQTCASVAINPMISTLTNEKGEFTLKDVPVDKNIPVVVQVGKWRRKLTIDITQKCSENKVPDKQFRLPKNGSEGDIPQIAVTAGGCDGLEGLLRGIGVDDAEFVAGDDPKGHIHVFAGEGGKGVAGSPKAGGSTADPLGGFLWNDAAKMQPYDMVLLSCECSEYNENKGGNSTKPMSGALFDYANMGGRIFATHYHYTWFKNSVQPPWAALAKWGGGGDGTDTYDITQTLSDGSPFPKGVALAQWLMSVNASSTLGKINLTDVTDALTSVNPPAQSWISQGPSAVRYFSFNAPTDADPDQQCGRAVYSDLHLMGISAGGQQFPTGSPAPGGLNAQQKALEFMFFDLASCVQADDQPPTPPQ